MDTKKDLNIIWVILSFILGGIAGEIIEQVFGDIFKISTLPQQILIISLIFIIIIIIAYLIKMVGGIESKLNRIIFKPLAEEIPCSFISNQQERLEKIIKYINIAKKQIYIYSYLSNKEELDTREHKNYLNALNRILERNKKLNFLRIVVPYFDASALDEKEYIKMVKDHPAYKDHFNKIIKCRTDALLAQKGGPTGMKILLIDDRYLFLSMRMVSKDKILANFFDGGFFFEDIGKNYTPWFQEFFKR